MGQIVGGAAKPKRCNLNKLSQLGTPAAGEHILVSSDNSMNAAGQGNFDCYIVGDGTTDATALKLKSVETLIGIFDISEYHATGDVLAKYADLSAALDGGNNIPQSLRKGGMSVKFVRSSDNKYVQYRLTADEWSTNTDDWRNVEDEINYIKLQITEPTNISGENKYYIILADAQIGEQYTITKDQSNSWTNWELDCNEGDTFVLTTKGNLARAKAYAILDTNNIVLELHQNAVTNKKIIIPQGGVKLLVNSRNDQGAYSVVKYVNRIDILDEKKIGDAPQDNKSYIRKNENWVESTAELVKYDETEIYSNGTVGKVIKDNAQHINSIEGSITQNINISPTTTGYYINLISAQVGQSYTIDKRSSQSFSCWELDCNEGDTFVLTTKGNLASAKAYAILDTNNIVLELHQDAVTNATITIQQGGVKLLVNSRNDRGDYFVKHTVNKISKLENDVLSVKDISFDNIGYINLKGIQQGAVINPYEHIGNSIDWRYIITDVKQGQVVTLTTSNNLASAKSYAILDEDYQVLQFRESDSVGLQVNIPAKAKYFIANTRIATPTRESSCSITLCSKDYLQEQIDEINTELHPTERDFLNIIDSQKGIIPSCCGFGHGDPTRYCQNAALVVITDIHGCGWCVEDAGQVKSVHAVFNKTLPSIINMGDMFAGRPCHNGVMDSFYDTYMELAKKYCVYHTIGQHEVGFDLSGDNGAGRDPLNCLTHDEVFNKFIAPMKSVWGLPDLDTVYYYKDLVFSNSGSATTTIRLISLYEFNCPLYLDGNGKYKYNRATIWYGSTQLQWLADTLASSPEGALVVLMTHKTELRTIKYKETPFAQGTVNEDIPQPYMMLTSDPIVDIVNAFINRENFSKLYSLSSQYHSIYTESDFDDFTITKDFTQCGGVFANEFTGDTHVDKIGKAYGTNMLVFTLTSSGNQAIDCDVDSGDSISSSIINVVGYNKMAKRITIGRLGQQYSLVGVHRDIDNFTYV